MTRKVAKGTEKRKGSRNSEEGNFCSAAIWALKLVVIAGQAVDDSRSDGGCAEEQKDTVEKN